MNRSMIKQQSAARPVALPKYNLTQNGDHSFQADIESRGDHSYPNSPVWKYHADYLPTQPVLGSEEDNVEDETRHQYLTAQAQWDAVETITPGSSYKTSSSQFISFNEALQYFQTADLEEYRSEIKTSVRRSRPAAFWHALFGPPKLHKDLVEERDMFFIMGKYPFRNEEDVHNRVLQTIYKKLTGSRFDCSRFGDHWQEIGFQGTDPLTDLRGAGFLALMNILHFVMDPDTLPLARDIFKLSNHETQNFPFCVMGINLTRICLQTLREGCLNRECNLRQQVLAVINDFYVAVYLYLYQKWKKDHKTVIDSSHVLKDIENQGRKDVKMLLRNLEIYSNKGETKKTPRGEKYLDFAGVDEIAVNLVQRPNDSNQLYDRNDLYSKEQYTM